MDLTLERKDIKKKEKLVDEMKKRNVQLHWRINQKKKEEKKEPHAFIKTQQHTPVSLPPACQEDRCPPTAYTPPLAPSPSHL